MGLSRALWPEIASAVATEYLRIPIDLSDGTSDVRLRRLEEESTEERRLWADFYEATARVLELIRTEGTTADVIPSIVAEHLNADRALARIKQIRGIR